MLFWVRLIEEEMPSFLEVLKRAGEPKWLVSLASDTFLLDFVRISANCRGYCRKGVTMRWLLSFLLFALLGIVHAISSSGNRLLVVNEEPAEKDKYSKFWADLEG